MMPGVCEPLQGQLSLTLGIVKTNSTNLLANVVINVASIALPALLKRTATYSGPGFITLTGDDVTFEPGKIVLMKWMPEIKENYWGVLSLYYSGINELSQIKISH